MAHIHTVFAFISLLLALQCLARSTYKRELVPSEEHARTYHFSPPHTSSSTHRDGLEILDIALLASVDGKLHALNRTSGELLWSMSSSNAASVPSTLRPLVQTHHTSAHFAEPEDDMAHEVYVIEPQSGDLYVMSSPKGPLQRLPFSLPQLVDMSPFYYSEDDDPKVFVGRKETSLLLLELETGKVKATINSECPWDPFEDPFEDLKDGDLDLDELEGSKPQILEKSTEVFIGRTDYHVSIHTRRSSPHSPHSPVQNLSFSVYGPNNQDNAIQSLYHRTLDDIYIQPSSNGGIMSFRIRDMNQPDQKPDSRLMWGMSFTNPIVAVLDVINGPLRQHPFVLLQPIPGLQDIFPEVDFSTARHPNLKSAYVGMVEETGSLFTMSPNRFPLVTFGDVSAQWLIGPPPVTRTDVPPDLDALTRARKLRELCQSNPLDPKCLIGIHRLETDSRTRFNRLIEGTPLSVSIDAPDHPPSISNDTENENTNSSSVPSSWKWYDWPLTTVTSQILSALLFFVVGELTSVIWTMLHKQPGLQPIPRFSFPDPDVHIDVAPNILVEVATNHSNGIQDHGISVSTPAVSPAAGTPHLVDDLVDVEDSDKDDMPTPGKRKPIRRRRGKKKKNMATNGLVESQAGSNHEDDVTDEAPNHNISPLPSAQEDVVTSPTLIVSDTILGFGSHGTIVFRGSLQGRAVAVKRMLQDFVTVASREVNVLQESDDHPNVIRYYYQEAQGNFLYIALELCPASLADIVERPDNFRDIAMSFDPKKALLQITSGLRHLHALKIIHRDIKPQNIMVSSANKGAGSGHRMLISDFGLCKKLELDQTSFMPTAFGAMAAGTVGWRAPEILRGEVKLDDGDHSLSSGGSDFTVNGTPTPTTGVTPTKLTKSVDIFALGCLFYYSLTNGGHPFGDRFDRESNILKDLKSLGGLEDFGEEGTEAIDLINRMLDPEAAKRPDTTSCLVHPYFWDADMRLNFLQDASDRFEIMCREPRDRTLIALESEVSSVVGHDWRTRLDKAFLENLGKFRKYDGRSVQDLLRALRNKKHHFQDLPENVRRQLNPMPTGYLSYFTRRFPHLFLHVYSVIVDSPLKHESVFRPYFELSEQ